VDSARLTATQNDLSALNLSLPKEVTTTDIKDIMGITTTQTPPTTGGVTLTIPIDEYSQYYFIKTTPIPTKTIASNEIEAKNLITNGYTQITRNQYLQNSTVKQAAVPAPDTAPVVIPAQATTAKPEANALTLYEWYQAQGQTLPSVSEKIKNISKFRARSSFILHRNSGAKHKTTQRFERAGLTSPFLKALNIKDT